MSDTVQVGKEDLTDRADAVLAGLLFTPEGRRDPYPLYRQLREMTPVHHSRFGPVVLSRYDDCTRALRDHHLGKGAEATRLTRAGPEAVDEAWRRPGRAESMLFLNPPEHTRQRRLVSRAFTPNRVEALRPEVQRLVDGLLDNVAEAGEADIMAELAFPLPVTVIGELLGVPEGDRASFQSLVRDAAASLEVTADDETLARASKAEATMADYFAELMDERRARPRDDLLTALVAAREQDDALEESEIIATALLLFGAGFETTTNLIGNGLLALLRHPDQLARLRGDSSLLASAVEELLRWDSPVQLDGRTVLEDVDLDGIELAEGQVVLTLLGGANRDPARFSDPERLDVGRADNVPLSFGSGIHHCLGAALARMEGQVVFARLLGRFAGIELLVAEPEVRPGLTLRGLATLPVRVAGRRD